jgi:tRNA A-37 threonylcarbamoyl transferase component Bud32
MSVPQRVLFGYKGRFPNRGFFLVTENVKGACIDCQNHDQIFKLAKYLAKLHAKGVFHRDIHPENVFVTDTGELVLLDVQEIYCLPYLPYWLKVLNIGKLWWHIRFHFCCPLSLEDFLSAYNAGQHRVVSGHDITKVEARCQKRYFQSRSKRCCKNSTEFQIIKDKSGLQGFKRRDFLWKKVDLEVALDQGKYIKRDKIIAYGDVCVKIYNKQIFHKDRCLTSWKMARALSVRGINVPKALAYYSLQKTAFFLSVYYRNSMTLNIYFNKITGEKEKKAAMRRFADWLKRCHDLNIWQRDFKSSNVLVQDNQFIMIDLEGVRICRNLSWRKKIINLAQLNASMSNHLTLKDRLLFFHFYCRENLPSWKKRRWAYYKIWKISECKNTLPFGLDLKKLKENSLLGTHV